jgi:Response regulator containing CheY-like receiver, AAA-type ATPase, and DNA-binding domains
MVMLVDDHPGALATMMRVAIMGGFLPVPCRGLSDVRAWFNSDVVPAAVVTDVMLEGESGVALHDWVKASSAETPVIFITGGDVTRLPKGARVIEKPFEIGVFIRELQRACSEGAAANSKRLAPRATKG